MTTITRTNHADIHPPLRQSTGASFVADTAAMTHRNLLRIWRTPHIVPVTLAAPLVFVVLFDTIFGGSITTGDLDYIDFLVPGALVQTALFDSTNTATAIAHDLDGGSLDRFRSLPVRRSAVLIGRTAADLLKLVITSLVVLAIGLLLGFRPTEGPVALTAAVLLAVALGHTFHWAYAWLGIVLKDPAAVQSVGILPTLPLVFVASTFAPVENMPAWIRPIAEHQPVTVTVDAVRALIHGGELASPLIQSVLWCVGLLALWSTLATRTFDRLS
jgi:ABC transporter DrrB family efflux protein